MSAEVNALRRAVEPLAGMLSGCGLKVSFCGDTAMTEYDAKTGKPKKIILPLISDDADPDVISGFHGYLDHEVGHVLFTNIDLDDIKEQSKDTTLKCIFNMVEDSRIENCMKRRFRGSAYNLEKVAQMVFTNLDAIDMSFDGSINSYMNVLLVAIRALGRHSHFQSARAKSKHVDEMCKKLEDALGKDAIYQCGSAKEAMEIAKKIIELFELEENLVENKGQDSSEESEEGESEKSEQCGEGADGNGEDDKEDKSKPSMRRPRKGKDGEEKDGKGKEGVKDGAKVKLKMDDKLSTDDFFSKAVCDVLSVEAQKIQKNQDYSIYSTDEDKVEYAPITEDVKQRQKLEDKTRMMVAPIQKNLERAISARSIVTWENSLRRGKINASSLSRLVFNDDRVFRKKLHENVSKDVAVSLVIDCSGSMCGHKAELAAITAYALATVFERMGIVFELIGFTTKGMIKGCRHRGMRYSRYESLYMPIFKGFTDRWDDKAKNRLNNLLGDNQRGWLFNNVDGECVQIAANRLMARPEKGKIMIVLSDGYPSAMGRSRGDLTGHLEKTIKELENKFKIIGIGIDSDAVSEYYTKHVVLDDIEKLPSTVIQKIKAMLLSRGN